MTGSDRSGTTQPRPTDSQLVHATCITLGDRAALLRGPSGSGKSDLALRFLSSQCQGQAAWPDAGRARLLVSDDQTLLHLANGFVMASPPPTIAGRLEVRGIGIVTLPFCQAARIYCIVDLVTPAAVERMPEPTFVDVFNIPIARHQLSAFDASAASKLAILLTRA